jgi:predicted phosphodiesterase
VPPRLHVLSDLHLEMAPFEFDGGAAAEREADIVILAGDTATGTRGVQWAREYVHAQPVLYVAGNHEFYGHDMPGLIDELRDAASGSRVSVLENDEVELDGTRFLGCTLWSDFDFDGPEHRDRSMRVCERVVNDFSHIGFGPGGRPLSPQDARSRHLQSRSWLAERLSQPFDGHTVVITHHAPLITVRPEQPALRALAGAFASDVTELMDGGRVALWIYGHTHRAGDVEVNGTRVLSNPRGYPHQAVAEFDPGCVVEVGEAT